MEKFLAPEEQDAFFEDLAAQKLGVTVTPEEAANIAELARIANEQREVMENSPRRDIKAPFGQETKEEMMYGRAGMMFKNYLGELKKGEKIPTSYVQAIMDTLMQAAADPSGAFLFVAGITKTLKATFDNSALLRQGMKVLLTSPSIWQRQAVNSFKDIYNTFGSKAVMDELNASIISHPLYDDMIRDKLAITVIEEEMPQGFILEQVPVFGKLVQAADNAFTAFMYRNRVELYALYTDIANKSGFKNTTDMGIGVLANSLTSRGYLGRWEAVSDALNVTFFSIRNLKANFDVLTAHLLNRKASPFVKKRAAINLLKIIFGTAAGLMLASAMGADVERDPRSTDFGKFRIGDTRFDLTGGMSSIVVLAARLLSGSIKSSTTGEVRKTWGEEAAWKSGEDLVVDFFGNKLAPLFSTAKNVFLTGKTFEGEQVTVASTVKDLTVPLPVEEGIELWKNPNSAPLLLGLIAEFLGISTQTYEDSSGGKTKGRLGR